LGLVVRRAAQIACAALAATLAVAAPAEARGPGVVKTLAELEAGGSLTHEQYRAHRRTLRRARRTARRLDGDDRWNLEGVLANTRSLARRRMLAARLVPAFLTLARNVEWFRSEERGTAAYGARRRFPGSPLIFQFYPGSGWQIQPLGNFGKLNALARRERTRERRLRRFADALLAVAVRRRGSLAFEYLFPWSGGEPGWVSGMTTATGAAALARVWERTGDPRYRDAAESLLGAFFMPPPWGVQRRLGRERDHYLLYSQSPDLLVGNGFAQALIGLGDVESITGSTRARVALERGLRQADRGLPSYDTGAWSLYWRRPGSSAGEESDLHYHRLFAGFLETLCERYPERVFCGVRENFARYESEPVRLGRPRLRLRRRRDRLRVAVWTSKRGSGTITLRRGARVVRRASLTLERGRQVVRWDAPRRRRRYTVRIEATSLNGIGSARERTLRLR
jgi:D-glucuronyl C5-epimerase C-terminus